MACFSRGFRGAWKERDPRCLGWLVPASDKFLACSPPYTTTLLAGGGLGSVLQMSLVDGTVFALVLRGWLGVSSGVPISSLVVAAAVKPLEPESRLIQFSARLGRVTIFTPYEYQPSARPQFEIDSLRTDEPRQIRSIRGKPL